MNSLQNNTYDAFLSYSSKDSKYARIIQRFIETYKTPKSVVNDKVRLRVFRDKDDQGVTGDYKDTFYELIDTIPSFILLGSKNAFDSENVDGEIKRFVEKDSQNICLAWIDAEKEPQFSPLIHQKYPNAIYSDFRILKKTNFLCWLWGDKKKFKIEALRIIALLLSQKLNRKISLDQLIRREKQRTFKRRLTIACIFVFLLISLNLYLLTTPASAWQHTELLDKDVTSYQLKILKGKPKLWVTSEIVKRWEDSGTGESGHDSDITLYQVDEDGNVEGKITYNTCGIERELCGKDPEIYGVFSTFSNEKISEAIRSAFATNEDSLAKYQIDLDLFSKPSFAVSPYNNGTIYFSSVKDTYPYGPKNGGIYRSLDYGKKWEKLKMNIWDSFKDIVFDVDAPASFSVILTEITGTNLNYPLQNPALLPSVWATYNNGVTWQQVYSNMQNIDQGNMDLVFMNSHGNLIGTISRNDNSRQLIIYKKRTLLNRLLQKYDVF